MTLAAAVGIMCKAPVPGVTKTRLGAFIGADHACALSACFLRDVAAAIIDIPPALGAKGYGVYAPAGTEQALRAILPPSFDLLLQSDSDFGNVLHGAMCKLLEGGHDCVLLVNGDSPTLPSQYLSQAITELRRQGDRMILGPASDGGYYLIGLKAPHRELFESIPWSTGDVASRTIESAERADLEIVLLPEWYDVDDAESFQCLRDELSGNSLWYKTGNAAPATRKYLAALAVPVT